MTNVPVGPRGKRELGGKVATLWVGLDTACEMRCYLGKKGKKGVKTHTHTVWGISLAV